MWASPSAMGDAGKGAGREPALRVTVDVPWLYRWLLWLHFVPLFGMSCLYVADHVDLAQFPPQPLDELSFPQLPGSNGSCQHRIWNLATYLCLMTDYGVNGIVNHMTLPLLLASFTCPFVAVTRCLRFRNAQTDPLAQLLVRVGQVLCVLNCVIMLGIHNVSIFQSYRLHMFCTYTTFPLWQSFVLVFELALRRSAGDELSDAHRETLRWQRVLSVVDGLLCFFVIYVSSSICVHGLLTLHYIAEMLILLIGCGWHPYFYTHLMGDLAITLELRG